MKKLFTLLAPALLLSSCTINYYTGTSPESDDVYYNPSSDPVYVDEPEPVAEEVPAQDDYWSEDMNGDINADGDVYIDNYYNGGSVWDYPNSRFGTNYPFYSSFNLYYNNFGFYYNPAFGWSAGLGWGYRPLRPWACMPYDPWYNWGWGYGYGWNSWYCDSWYYPWGNYWGYGGWNGWGSPYGYGYGFGDNYGGGGNGFVYGHRDPISSGSSVNSGYTGGGVYSVGRHYNEQKPLATAKPDKPIIERPSLIDRNPDNSPLYRPEFNGGGANERPFGGQREINPADKPARDDNRSPVFKPENNPAQQPERKPDVKAPVNKPVDRPARDRDDSRPARDNGGGRDGGGFNAPRNTPSPGGGGGNRGGGGGGGGSSPARNRGGRP
jgi:hypothetical protein